jgi:hypothetical protein
MPNVLRVVRASSGRFFPLRSLPRSPLCSLTLFAGGLAAELDINEHPADHFGCGLTKLRA